MISTGHASIQNIRCGDYELGAEEVVNLRVLTVFGELALRGEMQPVQRRYSE